jgi:LPS-assembly protein
VVRVTNLNGGQSANECGSRSLRFSVAIVLRSIFFSISITVVAANCAHLAAQQVTTEAPPPDAVQNLGAAASASQYPDAVLIPQPGTQAQIETAPDGVQSHAGSIYTLDRGAVITFRDRTLQADHIEFNSDTGDVTLTGHVLVAGGDNNERIQASHGTFNVHSETGRFYDVSGSVGLKQKPAMDAAPQSQRMVYANGNPFLFTGKMVVKTGAHEYQVYDGTVTSCQLPRPDWLLSAAEFRVNETQARATNSIFHLMSFPFLWMPLVTHPVNASDRQTGILIPDIGFNSASKGDTIGEQVYWAINRSTDLTVGTIYYSARGWEQTASLRYHGLGQDFIKAHYSGLHDRGYYPGGGTLYVNQSGTDVLFSGRYDLFADDGPDRAQAAQAGATRLVADLEYLSSFPYREAFSTNFNQAVSSDVISTLYATHQWDGMAASLEGDRYQGEKRVATTAPLQAEEQVHIFHAPALEFTTADHPLGSTGLEWNLDSSVAALKRTQPGFATSGMIARLDLHPEFAYPLHLGGWNLRPSLAGRETFYSSSRLPSVPGQPETEVAAVLNRADVDVQLDLRPPVLERTFDSGWVKKLLHNDVKHTIEPEFTYRYASGINNFPDVLRFDAVDVASNTNEFEYGATQRLFLRRSGDQPCRAPGFSADATEILGAAGKGSDAAEDPGEAAGRIDAAEPLCGNREWISWRVAQKYFFDQNFGGAVTPGPRSILQTTLDFSGISFLTAPRDLSPLISRLRLRTSEKTDVEWDFDYDFCSTSLGAGASKAPCQQKFTANNVYVDVHQGDISTGLSFARLNAPARAYVGGSVSSVAEFSQMRFSVRYKEPSQAGFSAGASAGIDLDLGTVQYGAIQTTYNWNCCGVSVEYRKYELGSTRNDNGYKFNFTLANIGSAGNLRHTDQVF